MKITEDQLNDYLKATHKKKSYLVEDFKKTKLLKIDEFIYIADNFEGLINK